MNLAQYGLSETLKMIEDLQKHARDLRQEQAHQEKLRNRKARQAQKTAQLKGMSVGHVTDIKVSNYAYAAKMEHKAELNRAKKGLQLGAKETYVTYKKNAHGDAYIKTYGTLAVERYQSILKEYAKVNSNTTVLKAVASYGNLYSNRGNKYKHASDLEYKATYNRQLKAAKDMVKAAQGDLKALQRAKNRALKNRKNFDEEGEVINPISEAKAKRIKGAKTAKTLMSIMTDIEIYQHMGAATVSNFNKLKNSPMGNQLAQLYNIFDKNISEDERAIRKNEVDQLVNSGTHMNIKTQSQFNEHAATMKATTVIQSNKNLIDDIINKA